MSQTNIPAGSPLAKKVYGAALFARCVSAPGFSKSMTGDAPKQSAAEMKLKGQTAPGMPFVRVTDLSKTNGDTVSVDVFDTVNGKPLVGDRNGEGKGEKLTSSSMDIKIDLLTKVVDAGGKMTSQRTIHGLRGIAMAQLEGYFPRLHDQSALVHMAGARGSQVGRDWVVPLTSDADFSDILINGVKAPTYNRHYVVDSATSGHLIQGGQQLGSVDSADVMSLDAIDSLSLILDDLEYPIQSVRIADDPAADDDPIKGVLYLTPRQWNAIKTSTNWRTYMQNAWARKSLGSKHPLFSGEPGLWNGILIRQLPRYTVRFAASENVNIITAANRYTATESVQAVAAGLSTTHAVERALFVGAQALGTVYGRNQSSDTYFSWLERRYNFERSLEVAGDAMMGMSKLRFNFVDGAGNSEPTDHGVIAIDSVVKL